MIAGRGQHARSADLAPVQADGSAARCRTELGDLHVSWDLVQSLLCPATGAWPAGSLVRMRPAAAGRRRPHLCLAGCLPDCACTSWNMYCAIFRSPPERLSTHSSRHAYGMIVPPASSVTFPSADVTSV